MSAQILRDAAKVLRERAEAVRTGANEPDMWFGIEEVELALTYGDQADMGDPRADAAYISTVHPGVGLAIADWLESYAGQCGFLCAEPNPQSLAVARAILR